MCDQEMAEREGGSEEFESREVSQANIIEGLDFRVTATARQESISKRGVT